MSRRGPSFAYFASFASLYLHRDEASVDAPSKGRRAGGEFFGIPKCERRRPGRRREDPLVDHARIQAPEIPGLGAKEAKEAKEGVGAAGLADALVDGGGR